MRSLHVLCMWACLLVVSSVAVSGTCTSNCDALSAECTIGSCDTASGTCILVPKSPPPAGCCVLYADCSGPCTVCNFGTHQCEDLGDDCRASLGLESSQSPDSTQTSASVSESSDVAFPRSPRSTSASSAGANKEEEVLIGVFTSLGSAVFLLMFAVIIVIAVVIVTLRVRGYRGRLDTLDDDDFDELDDEDNRLEMSDVALED
mmetsp:Transcript_17202/g.66947  ORF Transcript_17202/g.66947 Transcript_17202/m.66947 type:complete len:204 (+) Transcript_17202:24-635(+)